MNKVLKFRQTPDQTVYWLSDTHLNHNRDFVFGKRGFANSVEHTDTIINKINEIVKPNDILMHAGDFCLNTEEPGLDSLLARINCQNIYMTWGNHNNPLWKIYQREVKKMIRQYSRDGVGMDDDVEIYPFRYKNIVFLGNYVELTVDGAYFVMAHYPIHVWNYVKDGAKMICGHSHYGLPFSQAANLDAKILDVGWDGYCRPLSTKEVLAVMDTKEIFNTGDHHKAPPDQMNDNRLRIGIDLGWTVKGHKPTNDRDLPAPDSFRVIAELIRRGDIVYIISKVTSEQRERALKWLAKHNFFDKTGVKRDNLYFCFERKDKTVFVRGLGVKIMIDDRPEVMAHLDYDVIKLLINPDEPDMVEHKDQLFNVKVVKSWNDIERTLF